MNAGARSSDPMGAAIAAPPTFARRVGAAWLIWLRVSAVIFGGFEIMERVWLWRYSDEVRDLAQRTWSGD